MTRDLHSLAEALDLFLDHTGPSKSVDVVIAKFEGQPGYVCYGLKSIPGLVDGLLCGDARIVLGATLGEMRVIMGRANKDLFRVEQDGGD